MPNPLPTPLPLLSLDARAGGVTSFIQDGSGFSATTTATVVDQTGMPNTFTFAVQNPVQFISANRVLITVTCTPPAPTVSPAPPLTPRGQTNIVVTTTTGANVLVGDPVPVILRTHRVPVVDHTSITMQTLVLTKGTKSVVHLPVTGFGDNITGVATADKGKWSVVKAVQKEDTPRVKVTLKCTDDTAVRKLRGHQPLTSFLSITLIAEDDTALDVPAIPVTYAPDPDDPPD